MKSCVAHACAIGSVLILLSIAALPLAAQTQTFDLASFTPPAGWTASQDRDHVVFTAIDDAARTFVMLAVYSSAPASGDAEKDFSGEWNDVVGKSFSADAAPRSTAGRSTAGLRYREGGAPVMQRNGQPAYVRLLAFSADKRRFSVLMIATNQKALEARQTATQAFVDSIKLLPQTAASARPVVAPAGGSASRAGASPSGAGAAPRPGSGITGVWMGFRAFVGEYEPKPRWYTFYDDGQIFEDLPRAGFVGFNREASKSDSGQHNYWGSYAFANGSGAITKPGVRYPETLLSEGAGKLKIDSAHFYLCHPVDGLRLQGAWTTLANPNDPDLDRWAVGQRPIFRFTADGQFADEGVFATFLKSGDPRQDAAGAGTYDIRDFTLILRYSDGRVKQLAFTGMLGGDPATSNDVVFIARSQFRKRK